MNSITRRARLAHVLWIVWAIVVWNVVFDRVLALAGRTYVHDAWVSAQSGRYLLAGDRMGPAVTRGLTLATVTAAAILLVGIVLISVASRRLRSQVSV